MSVTLVSQRTDRQRLRSAMFRSRCGAPRRKEKVMRTSKAEREARASYIHRRAYELAYSGTHTNWLSIENTIRCEGYDEAWSELDQQWLRNELDRICESTREPPKTHN